MAMICSYTTIAVFSEALSLLQVFVEKCQGFKVLGDGYQERGHTVQLKAVTLLTDIVNEQVCSLA